MSVMAGRESFAHPETGEVLETQADFRAALAAVEERLAPLYRLRRSIREAHADRFEPVLPERKRRTETQDKVARCPRCGGRLDEGGDHAGAG